MKLIHDLADSFSDRSLWLSIFASRDVYIFTLVRKRGVICAVDLTYIQGVY